MLSAIKTGAAKLPMDRVIKLAGALETDPARLARLALEQFFGGQLLDTILSLSEPLASTADADASEVTIIAVGTVLRLVANDVRSSRALLMTTLAAPDRIDQQVVDIMGAIDEMVEKATPVA